MGHDLGHFTIREFTPTRHYEGIGGYYDRCRDEAQHWRVELARAEAEGTPRDVRIIKARLEQAEYTGD